jgi:hypothetical protein
MKRLFFLFALCLPVFCFSQVAVSDQIYGFNMPIELDRDTTYSFLLDGSKCSQSISGVNEYGGGNFLNQNQWLYFYHKFSLNCCTQHYYQINVRGDSILISHSEAGDFCLCGGCTYELSFSDKNPQKNEYHIFVASRDTTVSRVSKVPESATDNRINVNYSPVEYRIYISSLNPGENILNLFLFDTRGKEILRKQINANSFYLDTESLDPGIYILRARIGTNYLSSKILIYK